MENTRVKKIVILVAALLALTIVGLQFGLTNFMQAFAEPNQDVKVEYNSKVNEEKTEAQVQINATPKEQDVEITSIELPNGEVVNDTTATYTATENGKLTFKINYKLPKVSSEQPLIEKEPEYEEKQQTTTYQVTGIQPVNEQEEQAPTVSSPDSVPESAPESNPSSTPESNLESAPESNPEHNPSSAPESTENNPGNSENAPEANPNSPPALIPDPSLSNGALGQNNLGDTPYAYTPEHAFTINSSGVITGYNVAIGGLDVNIPPTINGIAVREISGFNAFKGKGLTSVVLPEGLQRIQSGAFRDNKLTRVTIPSATDIGNQAFLNNQLTEVHLPANLQTLGSQVFTNNRLLTSVIIPSATSIGYYAFQNCKITGALVLPPNLQTIGENAFYQNKLTSVTIPSSVTSIGINAFAYNQLTSVTIPSSVISIGNAAFQSNQLTEVQLSEGLQTIGGGAFASNSLSVVENQISFLEIPESVTSLGAGLLSRNTVSGKGYHWNSATSKYEVNLATQIPGFKPENYIFSTKNSAFCKNMTDYSYNNTTGIFSFSSSDVNNASFSLTIRLRNSHTQEDVNSSYPEGSIIMFKNLQPSYNVTLNLQGGYFIDPSFTGEFIVANGQAIGQNIGANEVKYKPGYQFKGWYTDAECTQPFNMMTDIVTHDMTIYANWAWDETQNPSILVAIDQSANLKDYYLPGQPPMAKASINISLVETTADDKFKPTKNVVIKTDPHPIMERVNHIDSTPSLPLQVLKPNGDLYTNPNDALMKLNYFASSGNPTSATYTVQAPIDHTKLLGVYTGNMTYTISLE